MSCSSDGNFHAIFVFCLRHRSKHSINLVYQPSHALNSFGSVSIFLARCNAWSWMHFQIKINLYWHLFVTHVLKASSKAGYSVFFPLFIFFSWGISFIVSIFVFLPFSNLLFIDAEKRSSHWIMCFFSMTNGLQLKFNWISWALVHREHTKFESKMHRTWIKLVDKKIFLTFLV